MNRMKIAVVGYGNLGRGVHRALKSCPDMELVEIITRDPGRVKKEVKRIPVFSFKDFKKIADIAILCGGSKEDLFGKGTNRLYGDKNSEIENEKVMGHAPYFAQFFNTVDSFDTHARIYDYWYYMTKFAALNGNTAIISAGWDPVHFH